MTRILEQHVRESYRWLDHRDGYSELLAVHPAYKAGRDNYEHNFEHSAFPRIWYAHQEDDVLRFVEKHQTERMVCIGLNPRSGVLKNERGFTRAAHEDEIVVSKSLLLDFDIPGDRSRQKQKNELATYLETEMRSYFFDLGFEEPVVADSGNGMHVLCAYPAVPTSEAPDIASRLSTFASEVRQDHQAILSRLEAQLDTTQDLRRMLKVYGTAKPNGPVSRWPGRERVEDEALRDYLLNMALPDEYPATLHGQYGRVGLVIGGELPESFQRLLHRDSKLKELWEGRGKPEQSDQSGSGYDYSLMKRAMQIGYRDLDGLATVLALFPKGSVRTSGKGELYIRRTIANALVK